MKRLTFLALILVVVAVGPAYATLTPPSTPSGATSITTYSSTGSLTVALPGSSGSGSTTFSSSGYINTLAFSGGSVTVSTDSGNRTVNAAGKESEVMAQSYSGTAIFNTTSGPKSTKVHGSGQSGDGTIVGTFKCDKVDIGSTFATSKIDVTSTDVSVEGQYNNLTTSLQQSVDGKAVTWAANYSLSNFDAVNGVADATGAGRISVQATGSPSPTATIEAALTPTSAPLTRTASTGLGLLLTGFGMLGAVFVRRG